MGRIVLLHLVVLKKNKIKLKLDIKYSVVFEDGAQILLLSLGSTSQDCLRAENLQQTIELVWGGGRAASQG